jgi:hypothetical protein
VYAFFLIEVYLGFGNIQEKNSALYSLLSNLSNEVLLGIPFHLKKKVRGGCELPEADTQKPYTYAKMLTSKSKNLPVSGFFTKIPYVQVMNLKVKVSTLYYISICKYWVIQNDCG